MAEMKNEKEVLENIKNLFGLAHDLIASATHPGHLSPKVAEALNFLKFQFDDFERRLKAMEAPSVDVVTASAEPVK